jgi:uncharacterized protein involved in outer membrane biogenesis
MKILKKTLKITGISLLVLIALAFLIPIIFKKQITNLVKSEINKSLVAKVDFKDVSLSLFRHFPKVSITIDDLNVVGTDVFEKDTLISAKRFDASANLFSVIKGDDIKIHGIYLESPRIHALVNKDGKANWDIARPDTATVTTTDTDTSASAFKMSLSQYKISDGYIYYKDETSNMSAEIVNLNHEGSGDFTQDVFTLSTDTQADEISFNYEGIPYLARTKTDIGADIEIDNKTSTYKFKTDDIAINNLKLSSDGSFQLVNDSTYKMDINFKTPSNEFKDILSLVPGIYKQDFDKIKTSGTAALSGFVKGTYSPQQLPAYDVKLQIKDGSFQYPDLPKPVKNIQLDAHFTNSDGQMDNTVVDISKGHIEMDNEPFDFKVLFKNPETAQYIDAMAKGKINLADVTKFVKLEGNTKLAGQVAADIFAKGNMSALQTQQGDFKAGGFLDIKNLFYSSSAFPQPIQNGNIKVQVENTGGVADNTSVNIPSGHIELGQDPFDFTLALKNPMSSADFHGSAKGRFTLDNVKQFTAFEPGTTLSGILNADVKFAGNKTAIDKGEYDKINTSGTASLANVKYVSPDYPGGISIPGVNATFTPTNVTINNFSGSYLKSNFTGSGSLDNLVGYALKDEALKGTLNVAVDKMNLNDWMGTEPAPAPTPAAATPAPTQASSVTSEPFLVPGNIDITLNTNAGNVVYDKVDYNNINGTVRLADETVTLKDVKTEALNGTIAFNGSYSTKTNKKEPDIAINYDIKDVDIQKAFLSFNTVQKLMPIGQFLSGKLSSQLSMKGNLNGDMMPDLSSLTGKGNMLLLEGVLKKFAPLEKLASTLQISELQSISIKDIKNYIEFANGKVLVKPFPLKVKDIEMEIGGMHGFDQSLEYFIQMKVPRKYLGTAGNNLINNLASQANNKGIPVKLGDVINLNVKMGGSVSNPTIKTDLKEAAGSAVEDMKEQAQAFVQAKIDSTKQAVKDTVKALKNELVNQAKDELKNRIFGKDTTKAADSTPKQKPSQTIKDKLGGLLNRKKTPKDSVK